jgi:hypothetical protein
MTFKALFILPALNGIVQTFPLIISEEITDICIVLELLVDDSYVEILPGLVGMVVKLISAVIMMIITIDYCILSTFQPYNF